MLKKWDGPKGPPVGTVRVNKSVLHLLPKGKYRYFVDNNPLKHFFSHIKII